MNNLVLLMIITVLIVASGAFLSVCWKQYASGFLSKKKEGKQAKGQLNSQSH